jgi:methionine synthase I (cobalamin-dependent)
VERGLQNDSPSSITNKEARTKQTLFGTSLLLADGAMGTELLRRGLPASCCLEAATITHPELVASIHRAYRVAGAQVLTTNTFGSNRFRLAHRSLADHTGDFNRSAARLTCSIAGGFLVAGSIGPSGAQGALPPVVELRAAFREQALALAEGGVDLFLCETFGDAGELRAAVLGIRDISELPIVASMSYGEDGRTLTGEEPAAVVESLGDLDIAAIGANCCIGESTIEKVIAALHDLTPLPLVVRPNAGQPRLTAGIWRYPLGPREFAKLIERVSSASWLVGGCCGTTPAHISAVHALRGQNERSRDS